MKVGVNPPKTPVTKGSSGMAAATVPNVCKMPGPPAPFVPTPLPNIGQSSDGLAKATKKVKFEKKAVAIKGSTFNSKGDIASKGTGGGLVSATTHGTTKFVAPGSMNVKAEGKNVQLLGDQMTNNNSNPANALTIAELQGATTLMEIEDALAKIAEECNDDVNQNEGYTKSNPPSGGLANSADPPPQISATTRSSGVRSETVAISAALAVRPASSGTGCAASKTLIDLQETA